MHTRNILTTAVVGLSAAAALVSLGSAAETSEVYLTISGGNLSIGVTGTLDLGTFTVSEADQTVQGTFTATTDEEYFWIKDLKGADAGYYTTLEVSDMVGANGTIPAANISLKVDPATVTLLDGTANPRVELDAAWSSYRVANTPLNFIKRDATTNNGLIGLYGVLPSVQVVIPAYQAVGDYVSTITYTLYEN